VRKKNAKERETKNRKNEKDEGGVKNIAGPPCGVVGDTVTSGNPLSLL
jgi:hypothetical protein